MSRAWAALAALTLMAGCDRAPAQAEKPQLLFLSSLPILFAEDFSLAPPQTPLRTALEANYRIEPIAIADAKSLGSPGGLLLMAQPRAQTAEALVDLDRWVRGGGHLLLLADPVLAWPSETPLGDPTAPMPAFADTGLLSHWGVTLFKPEAGAGAGAFDAAKDSGCALDAERVVARCAIGKGHVTIIADADFVRDEAGAARVVEELRKLAAH